jgi:hypothetical protein
MLMQAWDVFTVDGTVAGAIAGLVGGVVAHVVASSLHLNNGMRLLAAIAGFAGLFAVVRSTVGVPTERRFKNERIEKAMLEQDAYRILAEHESDFMNKARAFITSLPDTAGADEVTARAMAWGREQLTPYLNKYLPVATDTTAAAFADLYEEVLTELERTPRACITFIHGAADASSSQPRPSKPLEQRVMVLVARVFDEGTRSPQPRISPERGEALTQRLVTSLTKIHGSRTVDMLTLVSDPQRARESPREACAAARSVFAVVASMPPSRGGPMMRFMMDTPQGR